MKIKELLKFGKDIEEQSVNPAPQPTLEETSFLTHVWEGVSYDFEPREDATETDFHSWFEEYAPKAPLCGSCSRLIFPGTAVGRMYDEKKEQNVFVHMNTNCCPSGGFFVGHINDEGELKPYFPSGKSIAGEALQTNRTIVVDNMSNL